MASYNNIIRLYKSEKNLFTTTDVAQFLNIYNQRNLENLIKKLLDENVLVLIEKGKYYLKDKQPTAFELAYFLYNPSYISFETALNYQGVLQQFPFEITCVTTKKKAEKNIEGRLYTYSQLDLNLFTGYFKENNYLMATKEKALFDLAYMVSKSLKAESVLANIDFSLIEFSKVVGYLELLDDVKKNSIGKLLAKYI